MSPKAQVGRTKTYAPTPFWKRIGSSASVKFPANKIPRKETKSKPKRAVFSLSFFEIKPTDKRKRTKYIINPK